MIKEIKTKIQNPYDTEENWKNSSRILKKGEVAYTSNRVEGYYKVGNGVDLWKDLPYPIDNHTHAISDVTGLQTALDGKPKYETGTWTPVISEPGPLSFQPYKNPKYTKIGKLCILTVDLYLLFDSEAYPVSEDDKLTYPNYEYVDKTTVSNLESMGITFTTAELSTGAFMYRTLFLDPYRFPFSIDKLIGGTAHNLGTPYSSGNIIEGYNYDNGASFISVQTKVYCCNKPVYFSGRYAPPYYTTLCIMYLTSR